MNIFGILQVSGSALTAERRRAEVVAANMANAETTRTPEGGPYRRHQVVFRSVLMGQGPAQGVEIEEVVNDPSAPVLRFEPSHPDANAQGYVEYPAINPVEEMVDLMGAMRAYELNASAVNASKQMIQQSLELLR
jgi:flagellar basal-body rod protein FlgC